MVSLMNWARSWNAAGIADDGSPDRMSSRNSGCPPTRWANFSHDSPQDDVATVVEGEGPACQENSLRIPSSRNGICKEAEELHRVGRRLMCIVEHEKCTSPRQICLQHL